MRTAGFLPLLHILLLTSLSAAWPWKGSHEDISGLILRRQGNDNNNSTSSAAASKDPSSTITGTNTNKATASTGGLDESAAATTGGSAAATTGPTATSYSNSTTTNHATKTTAVDPRLPPGGIEMVTPGVFAASSYYKVGDYVTFGWNYTSLSVTPTAIDIMASCAMNNELYTIALNQSVQPTGAVTWDTNEYASATIPLLTATYTLIIYDAAEDISATPQAGYLAVQDTFRFAMYTPQPYTPLNEFKCATCSAALSDHERQALGLMLGMGLITLFSFTWFAGGWGVFS